LGTKCAISLTHIRKSLTNPNSRWGNGWNKGEREQKMLQKTTMEEKNLQNKQNQCGESNDDGTSYEKIRA